MEEDKLNNIRHSAAHMLAAAVMELYPGVKLGIGPTIGNGFYYDFQFSEGVSLSEEDLPRIQRKMEAIITGGHDFVGREVTPEQARVEFADQPFKLELVEELAGGGETLTVYESGPFKDLCRGGHAENTREIPIAGLRLDRVAGAYWRGDEKRPMLTRIYGLLFQTKEELDKYTAMMEEAKKRDHRVLGAELDLFTFADEVGPGLPLWMPKGTVIREELEHWAKETEEQWGYVRVATPHIGKHTLFEISGHLPYYKDDMYSPMEIDGEEYYLKGMNCPHHHMIFKSRPKSYRDLPLRYAEYGTVYRYEQSGTLFGLMRVRAINQNDAHIYCATEDAEEEFLQVLKLHEYYYNALGLTRDGYHLVIGLPDESKRDKYHGDKALWDEAERMMRLAIERSGITSVDDVGGAAFYGPKIDFVITSSIGREFAISTNQLDLYMPQRFNLEYMSADGVRKHCAVIHRAPLGSHERFIGFLIEHFAGAFPVWLSPVQVVVAPVSEKNVEGAAALAGELRAASIRVELDRSDETVGYKVRRASKQKVPYVLVIGERELESGTLSVRSRGQKETVAMGKDEFITRVQKEIREKSL